MFGENKGKRRKGKQKNRLPDGVTKDMGREIGELSKISKEVKSLQDLQQRTHQESKPTPQHLKVRVCDRRVMLGGILYDYSV